MIKKHPLSTFRHYFLVLAFLGLTASLAKPVIADDHICILDQNCPQTTDERGDRTNAAAGYLGMKIPADTTSNTAIDPFANNDEIPSTSKLCRFLTNASANNYFIPFKSYIEWSSFVTALSPGLTAIHCAYPFTGNDYGKPDSKGLYFGPTGALPDQHDSVNGADNDVRNPEDITAPVSLPYWKTGSNWPPSEASKDDSYTHTFPTYTCYEESPEWECKGNWVQQTCTSCAQTDAKGACTSESSYDCSYCDDEGSYCKKTYHDWTETYTFTATALDGDVDQPSWKGLSMRAATSETRPNACNKRCEDDGHDCTNCNYVVNSVDSLCGSANGQHFDTEPDQNLLCAKGTVSDFAGSGPWTWSCVGKDGGKTVSCKTTTCCPYWGCSGG